MLPDAIDRHLAVVLGGNARHLFALVRIVGKHFLSQLAANVEPLDRLVLLGQFDHLDGEGAQLVYRRRPTFPGEGDVVDEAAGFD